LSWDNIKAVFSTFPSSFLFVLRRLQLTSITIAQATQLLSAAMSKARSAGYKSMGIVVLDASGNIKASALEDGASMFRFDIARAKAWGAVGMGVSSRTLGQRAKDNPNFFVSLAATAEGKFLPQTGAVIIKDKSGQILGAMGASGGTGDEDEEICTTAIESIGLLWG
jgi:uncharacterized protein GlcG (DUF336 family)